MYRQSARASGSVGHAIRSSSATVAAVKLGYFIQQGKDLGRWHVWFYRVKVGHKIEFVHASQPSACSQPIVMTDRHDMQV